MSVTIVHDYLNQPGGAERVVLEMAKLWPSAPIYTSLYRPDATWPEFGAASIRTTFLDRLPVDQNFRALLPLYPLAFRSIGTLDSDLVISSSSGWAHGVRTQSKSTHVVYCYSPGKWLYSGDRYLPRAWMRGCFKWIARWLRRWDSKAAHRADGYITIAKNVQDRVRRAYGLESQVVYPPVNVGRFRPAPRGTRLLVVSRLLPYKRVDLVVRAASKAGLALDVVGAGPSLASLQRMAGPTVAFHGRVDDAQVTEMIECCDAVCFPGEEDFGIVPVEANAAGKPVVAFASGGALETLEDGISGTYFHELTPESVLDAIHRVGDVTSSPEQLSDSAQRFSADAFRTNLLAAVERVQIAKHG